MSQDFDSKNIAFWAAVEKTDPSKTKPAKVGGQTRTAVDAQYKKKMITKALGMYGISWGVVVGSEDYSRVHFEGSTTILYYTAVAFYIVNGERGEFPIAASIKEAYITQGGKGYLKIDDEAIKKVRTDALTKGFTDLGFCADIHMGMFDDQDYVTGALAAAEIKKQDDREAAAKEEWVKIRDWLQTQIDSAKTVSNQESFNKVMDRIKDKLSVRCQAAGVSSVAFLAKVEVSKEEFVK